MKVYAHRYRKDNSVISVATKQYRCTAPHGIIDPQPETPQELSFIRMTGQFTLVDMPEEHEPEELNPDATVEVFSLEAPVVESLVQKESAPEPEPEPAPESEQEPEPADDSTPKVDVQASEERYSETPDAELRELCELFGIKVRKNASRATMIRLLAEADPE